MVWFKLSPQWDQVENLHAITSLRRVVLVVSEIINIIISTSSKGLISKWILRKYSSGCGTMSMSVMLQLVPTWWFCLPKIKL